MTIDTTPAMPRISVRDGHPVVDVRDDNLWAQDACLERAYDELGEAAIQRLWEIHAETFWHFTAPAVAQACGYPGDVWAEGRSSGWLWPEGHGDFLDYAVTGEDDAEPWRVPAADSTADDDTRAEYAERIEQRGRFLRFAAAIGYALQGEADAFVSDVLDELAALDARREACIVRGEN